MEDSFPDDRLQAHLHLLATLRFPSTHKGRWPYARFCGLTTEQIAASLSRQRADDRATDRSSRKRESATLSWPYVVPGRRRTLGAKDGGGVLRVIYGGLIFTEGYANPERGAPRRHFATRPFDWRGSCATCCSDREVIGLLALMLLQDSRRAARLNADGDMRLLDDQDRALWDRKRIVEGCALAVEALSGAAVRRLCSPGGDRRSRYARAPSLESVDWDRVLALYDLLTQAEPSPVIKLNRAVALSRKSGAAAGLAVVDGLLADGELQNYGLVYAVRAQLCRELGRSEEARTAFECALPLARSPTDRRWIEKQIAGLDAAQLTS